MHDRIRTVRNEGAGRHGPGKIAFTLGIFGAAVLTMTAGFGCKKDPSQRSVISGEDRATIEAVLRKADAIDSVQYEIHSKVSMPHTPEGTAIPTTARVWQKIPYMRVESNSAGLGSRMIVRPEGTYIHNPSEGGFVELPEGSAGLRATPKSFKQLSQDILETPGLRLLGTESADGESAIVVEYDVSREEGSTTARVWFSEAMGVPLRMSSISLFGEQRMAMEVEYTNYRFDEIPDDVFEVPAP
jgi:outer membrane lipoprotein-sorting protein